MRRASRSILLALGLTLAVAGMAQAQNWPNLPANSAVGRLGVGPGPAYAIPLSVLFQSQALTTLSGGNLGFGTETNPQLSFVFSLNPVTGIASGSGNRGMLLIGVTGASVGYESQSYAASSLDSFARADGTPGSPAIIGAAETLGAFSFLGYNGSGWSTTARLLVGTAGAWTNASDYGTFMEVDTTPVGSATRAQAGRWMAGLIIGTSTTDPGAGNLQAGGWVGTGTTTISGLPSCSSALKGARYLVSNGQTSPTFLGAVSTTGSVVAPVFCNGSGWIYG